MRKSVLETIKDHPVMKTKAELKQFYESELKGNISSLEKYRKDSKKKKWRTAVVSLILLGIYVLFRWMKNNMAFFDDKYVVYLWLVFFLFFIWLIVVSKSVSTYQKYQRLFKEDVMKKLVGYINSDFEYTPKKHVSGKDYLDSNLTHARCDVFDGEDYVNGVIDKTPFGFSEVIVRAVRWKRYTSYEDNLKWIQELQRRKNNYNAFSQSLQNTEGHSEAAEVGDILVGIKKILQVYTKVFKGLFFVAEFNKHLNESTFVVSQKQYANLIGNEKTKVKHHGQLVKLENPEFEKIFSVYGSSQQEARYVLTPTMMEAILNVYKTCNLKIMFSFTGSKVYCAIPMKKDMFEPTVKRGIKYTDIEEFYMILRLIETIINEMNLNTRIWSKE